MSTPIRVSYRVTGGDLLTRRNMPRIRALSRKIDRCMVGPYSLGGYKCEYRLHHTPGKGFAWVEVYYGSGMCGYRKTIREAVIGAAGLGMDVVIDAEPVPSRPPSPYFARRFTNYGEPVPHFPRTATPLPTPEAGNK